MFHRPVNLSACCLLIICLFVACDTVHPWGHGQGGRATGGASVRIPLELPKKTSQTYDPQQSNALLGHVVSVHDGDTITVSLNGRKEKVRLIGIDAPELAQEPWGMQSQGTLERLVKGRLVRLETDIKERDQYGRLLAYVYVDDTFVNAELVRQGQAVLYTVPPNVAHVEAYRVAQEEAQETARGVWNNDAPLRMSPDCYRKQQKGRACVHASESVESERRILQ
jgi:micrococcal nuclease